MPLEPELVEMMHDQITLEPHTGTSKDNAFTYGDPVTVRCYIQRTAMRTLDREGREVTSQVQIILADPTVQIDTDARLTLPDGDQPAIINLFSAPDDTGQPYYMELRA